MSEIFISYARSTAVQAQAIAKALRSLGYSVWLDDELPAHRAYADVIDERLRSAAAVLVIWSAEAVKSQWVRAEADAARLAGKLVQLSIDGTVPPLPFNQIQCANMKGWARDTNSTGWQTVVRSVTELAGSAARSVPEPKTVKSFARMWPTGWARAGVIVIGLLALASVAFAVSRLWSPSSTPPSKAIALVQPSQTKPAAHAIRSIAVLPFDNYSGDPKQEYFADGMTDELTTDLATISALRVISRGSVMRFKGDRRPPTPQIAQMLNVDAVVEGSVVREGDAVRITAQLIDAPADRHIWADTFQKNSHDVLALQNELASAIARAIDAKLTPQEQTRLTSAPKVDPEAYDAYLKGQYFLSRPTDENLAKSITLFQRAINLDPTFAPAYASLESAYDWAGYNERTITAAEAKPKAKAAAEMAVKLDGTSAEAHTALANYKWTYEFDWTGAEREARRALELNPNYAGAHYNLGFLLAQVGRLGEASSEFKRTIELDPLNPQMYLDATAAYAWQNDYDGAVGLVHKAEELDPNSFLSPFYLGFIDIEARKPRDAIAPLLRAEQMDSPPYVAAFLGYAYGASGDRTRAMAQLDELKKKAIRGYVPAYYEALVFLGLGDHRRTLDCLERALATDEQWPSWVRMSRAFDPLRSEPRFKALLKKMNLAT